MDEQIQKANDKARGFAHPSVKLPREFEDANGNKFHVHEIALEEIRGNVVLRTVISVKDAFGNIIIPQDSDRNPFYFVNPIIHTSVGGITKVDRVGAFKNMLAGVL